MARLTSSLFVLCFVYGVHGLASQQLREGRQIFSQRTSHRNRERVRYPLCEVDGTYGSCLRDITCNRERGRFAGYCGAADGVCCIVDKTCNGYTNVQSSYFRNPSYPKNDTESRTCTYHIQVPRGICGIRLNFEKFELAKFDDGVCIRDTLTVLGTKEGIVTPVCGNMTNWSTSFAVNEMKEVTLAMVLQGNPAHTFSIRVTQLACDDVAVFHSPTYAGIRNADAALYDPPPTTKKPTISLLKNSTTTPEPEDETTEPVTEEADTVTTESMPDGEEIVNEGTEEAGNDAETTTTEPANDGPTTLLPGKIPTPSVNEVLIRALPDVFEDDGVYVETIDSTPAISAFRRAFEMQLDGLRVDEKCWQYIPEAPSTFRIIGGDYTGINEYPWQVALVYKKKFFCGGSIISDRHILTAAHCVFGSFSKGLQDLLVSLGDHDLRTKNETKNIAAKVKSIMWHLHYNPHTTQHDIAIIELQKPITFTYGISAVKLPTDLTDTFEGQNATVTGWGRYNVRIKSTNPIMKEFTGPLTPIKDCVKAWQKFPGISASSPNHVCLNVTMGTPCHGDSGGPLVACTGVQCTQIGVVSFGFPMCTNVGLPAVFTRVTHYKSWIDMNTSPILYS